jgi:hypothetical protein
MTPEELYEYRTKKIKELRAKERADRNDLRKFEHSEWLKKTKANYENWGIVVPGETDEEIEASINAINEAKINFEDMPFGLREPTGSRSEGGAHAKG